ncbi:MAG: DNA-binding protein WhiA [Erysipelotrichaceae bacterium]|nr:DNA-binding protein WhiA [Erysipelotrichaceae bacterium]
MSFTTDIKQEIANSVLETHCQRAQLSALIQLTSSLTISKGKLGILIRSESPTTSKRIVYLLKSLYDADTDLQIAKKTNLKKNNVYLIQIDEDGKRILEDLGLYSARGLESHPGYEILMRNCCAASYLAGAFLAYGSCNDPQNANYHLEISLQEIETANYIVKLISRFDMKAKIVKRRNRYVVYLKKADYVSDFLALIRAHDAMMRFEDERIARDLKNSLSRIDNCEIANVEKSIRAGQKQIEAISKIIDCDRFDSMGEKLMNAADIRVRYPEASLLELCEIYQHNYGEAISKSGMKHRLNKIESIADSLEDK